MCEKCIDRRQISLGLTEERVPEGQHICHLFNDESEMRQVAAKFLASGVLAREKVHYLVNMMTPDEMLDCLEELGVDARSQRPNLTVSEAVPTYCPHGTLDVEHMLDVLRDSYLQAVEQEAYLGARVAGETSWTLVEGLTDLESLLEYEARVNIVTAQYPITTCCQYDARRYNGSTIMDILAVHPVAIVRGQLVKNPYYIDPERFLRERRARVSGGDLSVTP